MKENETVKSRRWLYILLPLLVLGGVAWLSTRTPSELPTAVKRVPRADPELQAAANQAQSQIKTFIDRLQGARPGERFAVKGKFETEAGPEYLWIKDPVYSEGSFTGTLDQQPFVAKLTKGEPVTVTEDDVYDWLIRSGKATEGGFTEKVLSRE